VTRAKKGEKKTNRGKESAEAAGKKKNVDHFKRLKKSKAEQRVGREAAGGGAVQNQNCENPQ